MSQLASHDNFHRIQQARVHTARIAWDVSVDTDRVFPTPPNNLGILRARFVFEVAGDGNGDPVGIDIGTYLESDGTVVDADGLVAAASWSDLAASTVVGTTQELTLATTLNHANVDGRPRVLSTEKIRATDTVANPASGANISSGYIEIDYWIEDTIDTDTPES